MALYCIGDTHLSLAASKPMDIFGSRWQGYTEKLTRGWNSVVSPDDTVVVAGDISWGMTLEEAAPDLEFLSALNGQKLILKGNHDFWVAVAEEDRHAFCRKGNRQYKTAPQQRLCRRRSDPLRLARVVL